jgi:TrmH family RNA methyltransferase
MLSKTTAKYIQSLQQKKFRDAHCAFIAEGPKVVNELLLDNIFECEHLFCTERGFEELPVEVRKEAVVIKDFELEKISALVTAKDMLGVFRKQNTNSGHDIKNKLTIILHDIQDPGNLGTIIRTADWFGIENIICSPATADAYNPKVVQSTMASLGRVNIFYTDIGAFIQKHNDIPIYAAVLQGRPLHEFAGAKEGFILIGNESRGLTDELLSVATNLVTIPKTGKAESLNAAVATGIILYAFCNSR